MISNVYGYYLTQYAGKSALNPNVNKRSELRRLSNDIAKVNRAMPFCKIDFSEDAQKFAIDLKENALSIKQLVDKIDFTGTQSSTRNKEAISDDDNIVSAKLDTSLEASNYDDLQIHVKQLATSQINSGAYLPSNEMSLKKGSYSFDIEIANVAYEFQFNINSNDSNKDIQDKLARLINRADIGLVANVSSNGNTSALLIESVSTGTPSFAPLTFTISEQNSSKTGGVVEYFDLNHTTQYPSNAVFTINGDERSSISNTFTVNKALELKLNSQSIDDTPTTIHFVDNDEESLDNIKRLVSEYNSMLERSKNSTNNITSIKRLHSDLTNIARNYDSILESNGLKISSEGSINIDNALLTQSAREGNLSKTLTSLGNFGYDLKERASEVAINPMNYVNKLVVSYRNPTKLFNIPYTSSIYAGMLYNGYV